MPDQRLRKNEDPLDASNPRISLIVQYIVKNNDQEDKKKPAPAEDAKPAAKS